MLRLNGRGEVCDEPAPDGTTAFAVALAKRDAAAIRLLLDTDSLRRDKDVWQLSVNVLKCADREAEGVKSIIASVMDRDSSSMAVDCGSEVNQRYVLHGVSV